LYLRKIGIKYKILNFNKPRKKEKYSNIFFFSIFLKILFFKICLGKKSACLFLLQTGKAAGVGGREDVCILTFSRGGPCIIHLEKEREPLPNLVRSAPTCNSARELKKKKKDNDQLSTNTVSLSPFSVVSTDKRKDAV
jgi:hypothetical protein